MAGETAPADTAHEGHHVPPYGPREYTLIGVFLTVITAIELWISYADIGDLMIPLLIILSGVKFVTVVALFMHLRFDPSLLTRVFAFSFVLAAAILIALIALFWNDATDIVEPGPEAFVAVSHDDDEDHDEDESSSSGPGPSGQPTSDAGVSGPSDQPSGGAGGSIAVGLFEFGIDSPATVPSGTVEFVVQNEGAILHNLRVVRSDAGPGELPVEGALVDESQIDVVLSITDLGGGGGAADSVDLEPGRYLLICNVPGHYQLGMEIELIVE